MVVYVLVIHGYGKHTDSVAGVFDTEENAIRWAAHFKYDDYHVQPFAVETLKGWPKSK